MSSLIFTTLFPFCGLGSGPRGFLDAQVHLLGHDVTFKSAGGIDNDPDACADFERLTGSPALCADIAQLTPAELRRFCPTPPDVTFSSPPCKGFSALMNREAAKAPKYQRMNELVTAWLRLVMETWPDRPPKLILIENVPRIATVGKALLGAVRELLGKAGYVFHEGHHECGEIGGLAQIRRRYLLVARHEASVPPILYQPPKKRVRAIGEVLHKLRLPNDPRAGALHVMPKISWLNWIRLALIPAGGDWRDLEGVLDEGQARRAVFRRHHVSRWDQPSANVAGPGSNGPTAVADPRVPDAYRGSYGVRTWDEHSRTVTGNARPNTGSFSVADPRLSDRPSRHWSKYRVVAWDQPAGTVTGATRPGSGSPNVADPRLRYAFDHGYAVMQWDTEASPTVAGGSHPGQGAYSVSDPRVKCAPRAGAYGVASAESPSVTVTGAARIDNGRFAVADTRLPGSGGVIPWDEFRKVMLPGGLVADRPWAVVDESGLAVMVIRSTKKAPPDVPVILSEDGCWHRPLTPLELAVLQGIPHEIDGEPLTLSGNRVSGWRDRIGNAVPAPTARAIAEQMLVTLTHAAAGSFALGSTPVWVSHDGDMLEGSFAPAGA